MTRQSTIQIADSFQLPHSFGSNLTYGWEHMQCNGNRFSEVFSVGDNKCPDGMGVPHPGVDLNLPGSADFNADVFAAANGQVVYMKDAGIGYGKLLVIKHRLPDQIFVWSVYAHLNSFQVSVGQNVSRGQLAGKVGDSGGQESPHLHFEIRIADMPYETWTNSNDTANSLYHKYVNPEQFINNFNFFASQQNGTVLLADTFFRGSGYGYLQPGFHSLDGVWINNSASSLSLPPSWSATVYEGSNADGAQKFFERSDPSFMNDGYSTSNQSFSVNDTVSSLRVYSGSCSNVTSAALLAPWVATGCNPDPSPQEPPPSAPPPSDTPNDPGGKLVLCQGENYTNCRYELTVGWHPDIPQGEYNSISIPSGWSFILVDRTDTHETCYNVSLPKLQDHESWRFNIGEIAVVDSNVCTSGGDSQPDPLGNNQVKFWTRAGYSGSSVAIHFTNEQNTYWLDSLDFTQWGGININDDVESFELNTQTANRAMALYRDSELQGPAKCFTSSDSDLNDDRFSDGSNVINQASSARFFVGQGCDLRPQVPREIWVHAADKSKVVLTWPWGGPDDDGYHVYLFDGSTYQRVATMNWTDARSNAQALGLNEFIRSWTFTSVSCGQQYSFAVSSWNEFGESAMTHSVLATTPPCDCNDVQSAGVVLFEDALCRGAKVETVEPMYLSLINFNDRASSLHVPVGWSVEVFENTDSSDGLATCLTEPKWDLSFDKYWPTDVWLNDNISNARVFNAPNCGRQQPIVACDQIDFEGVALFDYSHCLGEDRLLGQAGFYNLTDFDNHASSIHVKPGWSIRVWDENTKQGSDYVCFHESKWDLKFDPYWNWDPDNEPHWDSTRHSNNNITSIEVFHDDTCGGILPPTLFNPADTYPITDQTDLRLEWRQDFYPGYWGELWGPNGFFASSGYLGINWWQVGVLEAGEYTLRVRSENFQTLSDWSTITFTVEATTPPAELTVSYTTDPDLVNRIIFHTQNCNTEWVHVVFGDGSPDTDSPCVDGRATTQHDYPYVGVPVTYTANVAGLDILVQIGQSEQPTVDCNGVNQTTGISLFAEKDCQGSKREFNQPGDYSLTDFNDQASSIVPASGWSIEVFEHSGSGDGHAFCVTEPKWDLALDSYYATQSLAIDNTISNIKVYADATCGKEFPQYGGCGENIQYDEVVLFDYLHCGGSEQIFDQPGKFELGFGTPFNDLASSVHIGAGWSILVYENSGWSGRSSCFAEDMWDLSVDKYWETEITVGNTISSVEVFNNSTCTADQPPPAPQLPTTPTGLLPTGGSFLVSQPLTLSWQVSLHAEKYAVEIAKENEKQTFEVLSPQYVFVPLEVGSYSWRVKAISGTLESAWSESVNFSVKEPEQPDPPPPPPPPPTTQIFLPLIRR